jgi:hypothetical protein
MLNAEKVIEINNFIDRVHTPIIWAFPVTLGIFVSLELFLPRKEQYENQFDEFFSWLKFYLVIFAGLVLSSQGFSGGCVIQIPQNLLAQQYLGRDWHPYGIVFRENINQEYLWLLRLFYFIGGLSSVFIVFKYWEDRIKISFSKQKFLSKIKK